MAGSSSKSTQHASSEQVYSDFLKDIKKRLESNGVWYVIEQGYPTPRVGEILTAKQIKTLKSDMTNDATALSIIRKKLAPELFMKTLGDRTAREAWKTLQHISKAKDKMKEASCKPKDEPAVAKRAAKNESKHEAKGKLSLTKRPKISSEDVRKDGKGLRNKMVFDVRLVKSAVDPTCVLNFPDIASPLLPSTCLVASVRFQKIKYDIHFYGNRRQKGFGSGWRKLVCDHKLLEGDILVFEILESSDTKLDINLELLKNRKRKVVIDFDDDHEYEDEDGSEAEEEEDE